MNSGFVLFAVGTLLMVAVLAAGGGHGFLAIALLLLAGACGVALLEPPRATSVGLLGGMTGWRRVIHWSLMAVAVGLLLRQIFIGG